MKTLHDLAFEIYDTFFGYNEGVYAVYKGTLEMNKRKKSNGEEV